MAERIIVRRQGNALVPVDQQGIDALHKLPTDREMAADVVVPRNIRFHRKAFALLQLAFSYWEPANFVTTVEKTTVGQLGKFLVARGLERETVRNLCVEFLRHLNSRRQTLEAEKSFEAFREFMTVEAGYFDVVLTPAGPKKVAKSWSFASMDETTFSNFYRALFNACWRLVLSQHFGSEDEAEAAAEQLLSFDS